MDKMHEFNYVTHPHHDVYYEYILENYLTIILESILCINITLILYIYIEINTHRYIC